MAERKIHTNSQHNSHGEKRQSGNRLRRYSGQSEDSAFLDEQDDVFETNGETKGPPNIQPDSGSKTDRIFHPRCDSGVSPHGRSTSTNSESRFSVHSWHTSSNKTNISDHSNSVKSLGSPPTRKKKNFDKFAQFIGKHVPFTSTSDASSVSPSAFDEVPVAGDLGEEDRTPQRTRSPRLEQNSSKDINISFETLVEPLTMFRALKLLEQRQASGNTEFAQTGQQVTFGSCAVGFFDTNGGRLTLPTKGVSLHIPAGAIDTPKPQMVYIYELSSRNGEPKLKEKETWLTPTVECGPPGLEFAKVVLLSLPHSAINHSQWHVTAHRGNNQSSGWDMLESGKDTLMFLDDKKITLAIDHFSPYKVSGRASNSSEEDSRVSKWMKAAIFPKSLTSSNEGTSASYQLRLCNLQDWKFVLREEGIGDESEISSESFPVSDDGENIEVRVKDIHPGWQIMDETPQFIQFDNVWSGYQEALTLGRLSIPFQLRTTSATTSTVGSTVEQTDSPICRMEVKQMEDAIIELVANIPNEGRDQRKLVSRQITEEEICKEIENRFLAQQSFLNPEPHSLYFLNDTRYRRVCTALDSANNIHRGWAAFAASMRVNDILIQGSLETWARIKGRSPSAMLLDFFFHDNFEMNLLDTLKMLSSLLLEIENNTAKTIVDDEIYEREQGDEPRYFDSDSPFINEDFQNGRVADECTNQLDASVASPASSKSAVEITKHKPKYLKWVANVSGFMSEKIKSRGRKKVNNANEKMETDIRNPNPETEASSQLTNGNKQDFYDHKQDITKNALSKTNSSGVNSLSSANSAGTTSDVSNIITPTSKKSSAPDVSDTPRYLCADSSKPTKPLSRQGTHDSGVFSHRGSSRASCSSSLQESHW
ncbi:uncharacterized protein [Amphiura filiformis]|uniref:uncharacterized protein n=1 Tax=Amphiura filiformis TaxID=82378 RepID=UPI003B210E48